MSNSTRPTWDAGRFLQTLIDFEVLPFSRCWKRLFLGVPSSPQTLKGEPMNRILLIGATSLIGQRLVQKLLEPGEPVRVGVLPGEAIASFADPVERMTVNPETLTSELFQGIQTVIYCTDLEKSQDDFGQDLAQATQQFLGEPSEKILFNFTAPSPHLKQVWRPVDDGVMGGVSQSELRLIEEGGLFTGFVSTANSGGFASVRTQNLEPPLNLSGYSGIQLQIKGDGQRYKFLLRCEGKWDGIAYSYSFDTLANQWQTLQIPFADLIPVFRARVVRDAGSFDQSQVYAFQFMLSKFEYDGMLNPHFSPGSFSLKIASVKAYGGSPLPKFIRIILTGISINQSDLIPVNSEDIPQVCLELLRKSIY